MTEPVVFILAERASNGPGGLCWPHDGAVIAVHDVDVAHQILRIEGFREAVPPPDHPVREPASTDAATGSDTGGVKTGKGPRRHPVAE